MYIYAKFKKRRRTFFKRLASKVKDRSQAFSLTGAEGLAPEVKTTWSRNVAAAANRQLAVVASDRRERGNLSKIEFFRGCFVAGAPRNDAARTAERQKRFKPLGNVCLCCLFIILNSLKVQNFLKFYAWLV